MQHTDEDLIVDLFLEFLEAVIHQILCQREIYSPALFARQRLYGIAVRKARHPELCQYIQGIIAALKTPLQQNILAKIVVAIKSPAGEALERFIIEPKLLHRYRPNSTHATVNLDILELEAHLRATLLKLQYSDFALPPQPPLGSSFEILIYSAGRSGISVQDWIQDQAPLEMRGEGEGGGGGTAEIVPIKSCRMEGAFQLQLYVERPK